MKSKEMPSYSLAARSTKGQEERQVAVFCKGYRSTTETSMTAMTTETSPTITFINVRSADQDEPRVVENHTLSAADRSPPTKNGSGIEEERKEEAEEVNKGERRDGLGVPLAAAFLVAEMSGSGVFALPKALANTGWFGLMLMVALCLAVGFSGTRLALCWMMLEERWEEYRKPNRRPYPAIAYRALGKCASYLTVVAQQATLIGVSTVLLLLAAQMLASLSVNLSLDFGQCPCTIFLGIILAPASWMATPKDFWPASVAAVLVMTCQLVVVIVKIVSESADFLPDAHYTQPSFSSFFLGSGAILFSFGGASTFPTIQNDMKDRKKFPYSVTIAFAVLLIVYGSMSAVGYGIIGSEVPNNILLAVTGPVGTAVRALTFLNLLFAYVILINPVAQAAEDTFGVPRAFGWRRCCLRSSLVAFEVVVALAVPDFGIILNLVGGSTIAFMSFVLPPLCYLRLSDALDENGKPFRQVSIVERGVLIGVVITGVVGGIVTTYTSTLSAISPDALKKSCFFDFS